MNAETVPTRFARSLLKLVIERDHDYLGALRTAGIDFDPLRPDAQNYRPEISALQYSHLYQQIISLLQDQLYGLSYGAATPGAFRMMCYCIIHCDNLGRAIRRACEFYRIFFQTDARMVVDVDREQAVVGYGEWPRSGPGVEVRTADVYGLYVWHRLFCWLVGRQIELQEVRFRDAAPRPASRQQSYQALFGCPVRYQQRRNEMIFPASFLTCPLVHTEQSLKEFLRAAPYPLMVMPGVEDSDDITGRVRALIGHDFSQGLPGFEEVTRALNTSAPTLRRRLKREGTSFQKLKDECRCEAAIAYLGNPELSINAVAALMGFTDPSAFHRSFKKWTGLTPGAYRARETNQPPAKVGAAPRQLAPSAPEFPAVPVRPERRRLG